MTKYNLSKRAISDFQNYSKMLEDSVKDMGHQADSDSKNVNLKMPTEDKDNTVPFEVQLEASRNSKDTLAITEKSLDKESKVYNDKRSNMWDTNVAPINLVSESYDQKKVKDIKAAESDKDTAFWDKYLGVQLENSDRDIKIDNNIPAVASQLQNKPERFRSINKNNPVDNGVEGKMDDMVMASLKKADAMLFHVYATAASKGREVNKKEAKIIADVSVYKQKVLAQFGAGFETPPNSSITVPPNSSITVPPNKEQMTINNTEFDLIRGPEGEGQLVSKIDGKVIPFDLPDYETSKVMLQQKGIKFDTPEDAVSQPMTERAVL
ncbi:MAG: hypothetical protein J7L15_08595 [Clostridiales bacterium]|nr:hypothetical protein [Clostridiales bacterium]